MPFWIRYNGGAWNGDPSADPTNNVGGISLSNIAGQPIFVIAQCTGGGSSTFNFGQSGFAHPVPSGFTSGCPASGGGWTSFNPAYSRAGTATGTPPVLTEGNLRVWSQLNPGLAQTSDSYTSGKYYYEFTISSLNFFSNLYGSGVGRFYTDASGIPANEGVPSFWFSEGRYTSSDDSGGVNFISGGLAHTFPTRLGPGAINVFGSPIVTGFAGVAVGDVFSVAFSPDAAPQKPPPPAPPEDFFTFLTCCNRAIMAHLYTFISATGASDYFTDFDIDIPYGGVVYKSNSLRLEGLRRKVSVGLNVDEQTLKIWASPTDTLFGANFLTGAEEGLLDGATIIRRRIVWEFATGNVAVDIQNAPLTVFTLFTGFTSQIVKGGASHIEFKVKSALMKLNVNMPRNYYQPGCLWTLFDQGCGLIKANFGVNGLVNTVAYNQISVQGGVPNATGADGISTYAQGRLLFNSGVNAGLQVLIDHNDGATLYLAYPLNALPSFGDSITFYPGCSKSYNTCKLKYNNQANFRGFDRVPPVMVSI